MGCNYLRNIIGIRKLITQNYLLIIMFLCFDLNVPSSSIVCLFWQKIEAFMTQTSLRET